ncbi:MAG: putative aldehyde reductase, partial [Streblomastix strix]
MIFSTLADGTRIPVIGLGSYLVQKPNEVGESIKSAIQAGYRHFDFAQAYQNQTQVGDVLKDIFKSGKVKREELFLTSKVIQQPSPSKRCITRAVGNSPITSTYFENTYEMYPMTSDGKIRLDPNPAPVIEIWTEMEKAKDAGLVKHIGVSNFN